jgi:hypothetical protein
MGDIRRSRYGVCLVFEETRLIESLRWQFGSIGRFAQGDVSDENALLRVADTNEILKTSLDDVVDRLVDELMHDLSFTKVKHWQTENEFRFVVEERGTEYVFVEVADSLIGIVTEAEVGRHRYAHLSQVDTSPPTRPLASRHCSWISLRVD